jgi:hypothetical protein
MAGEGLQSVRRWVNLSKLDQRELNSKQGSFETVHPRGFLEGPQYVGLCNSPAFRETTTHLSQRDFYDRLPAENDVALLRRMVQIETNEPEPRESVVKLIETRIKRLTTKGGDGANTSDSSGQSSQEAGAVGDRLTAARS